jgi:spore germination protein (amino acid permease)
MLKEKLNAYHIALLIYMIECNVIMLSLPRIVAENLGTNGWVGFLMLFVISLGNLFLYSILYRMSDGLSVFEIVEKSVSKWAAYPIYIGLALLWVTLGSFIGKQYILVYQSIAFSTTHPMLLYSLYAIMLYFLLIKGIYNIAKAVTIFSYFTIIIALFTFYYFDEWKIIRFTPFLFKGGTTSFSIIGCLEIYAAFVGYELCMFLFPYVERNRKWFKGVYFGHSMMGFFYLASLLIAMGFYSIRQLQTLTYPVINLLGYIEMTFINRVENLILTLFLYMNLVSTCMFCWAALLALQRIFRKAKPQVLALVIVAMSLGIASYPRIIRDSERYLRMSVYTEIAFAFTAPVILILLLILQKRKGKEARDEK